MLNPRISVNIPLFNSEKYIKDCIQSILNQTFQEFEIIIIDDGSKDNSLEIVKSFDDNRIRIFENKTNKGIVYTRNRAIKESKGKYIAILDSDDVAYPTRLKKQFKYLEQNSNIALVASWYEMIDENGGKTNRIIRSEYCHELIKPLLLFVNPFGQQTIMAKTEIMKKKLYDEKYFVAQDYDLWVRISQEYKIAIISEVLVSYRVHSESISFKKSKDQVFLAKDVMKRQLLDLGIDVNDDDLNMHYKISYNTEHNAEIKDFKIISAWLLKLYKNNKLKETYNANHLKLVLIDRWFHLCGKLKNKCKIIKLYYYFFYFTDFGFKVKWKVLFKAYNLTNSRYNNA